MQLETPTVKGNFRAKYRTQVINFRAAPRISKASNDFMIAEIQAVLVKAFTVALGLSFLAQLGIAQQTAITTSTPPPLGLEEVLTRLEERNAERAAALQQFDGTRIYRMQYRGFPSDRDAEMVVRVHFQAPNSKQFTVVSETGSKFVIDRVFKKLLESEQEAYREENRKDTALNRQNYDFELARYEAQPGGGQYVLKLVPKNKNKFLYRGTIWVDAKDFAVSRIEGEPGKNPSFWTKKTQIAHSYKKVNDFWLPAENHTESFIRLGGKADLSIEYQDYKILKTSPSAAKLAASKSEARRRQGIVGAEPAVWAGHIATLGSP